MEAITTSGSIANSSGVANAEEIRTTFDEHSQELIWLAGFLTGDDLMGWACVLDTCALGQSEDQIDQDGSWTWRTAIIRSTLNLLQRRIAQLASVYERRCCLYRRYAPLSLDPIELPAIQCDALRLRLDVLCRFVLILCGVEQRSTDDAALVLGVSRDAIEAAYSAVLELLDVMTCEVILESNGWVAALN